MYGGADRRAPPADSVFVPLRDRHGLRLALVFGNHAPGGQCPYYAAQRCHHCDIGAGEGRAFDIEANRRRLGWFAEHYAAVLPEVAHLVVYNSGSTLNERELPRSLLLEILRFAATLPALTLVSLDSREPYVTEQALCAAAGALAPGTAVRPILGIETADDHRRQRLLDKRMPRPAIVRAFDAVRAAADSLGTGRLGVDVNVVIGGPGTDEVTAVDDAAATARFVLKLGCQRSLAVDLNLHRYYPSRRGRARFPAQPRCSLPVLARAVEAIHQVRQQLRSPAQIFIGWQDEGHDTEQPLRAAELAAAMRALGGFNQQQDPRLLAPLHDIDSDTT